jgi:hypothetical protein
MEFGDVCTTMMNDISYVIQMFNMNPHQYMKGQIVPIKYDKLEIAYYNNIIIRSTTGNFWELFSFFPAIV